MALATQKSLSEKLYSNIKEVKARGAYVLALANEGDDQIDRLADKVIYVPETVSSLSPILEVIPMQILAYYCSVAKGYDPDKPRNLAKSVTVE